MPDQSSRFSGSRTPPMRITHFRIENFRNLRLAECENPPDFMAICGGNQRRAVQVNGRWVASEFAG
jgi:hypothetical protein